MRQQRLTDGPLLYTIGYEGRGLDGLLDALHRAGVTRLVDVRQNPWSRNPAMRRPSLDRSLNEAGIDYVHLEPLGAPRAVREAARDEALGPGGFEARYRAHLERQGPALDRLERLARERPTAVLCMERDARACHRRFVAEALQDRGWSIVDLS